MYIVDNGNVVVPLQVESSIDMSQISTDAVDPLEQSVDTGQVDWKSLTCLLCKCKFPSRDVLNKRIQFSELNVLFEYVTRRNFSDLHKVVND